LADLSELGVILLMFLAGLETDLAALKRVRGAALLAAAGGAVLPFLAGTAVVAFLGFPIREAVFVGTVITATSVSITAETLMELGQLGSREGTTILGAAVIDDVIGVVLVSLVAASAGQQGLEAGPSIVLQIGRIVLRMGVYLAAALLLGRLVRPFLKWVSHRFESAESLTAMAIGLAFLYAWGAEYLGGLAAITGAYLLGAIISGTDLAERIESSIRVPAYALLVPIFFMNIGMQIDARQLVGSHFGATVVVVAVAVITKVVGASLGSLAARFRFREALRVGVGMISRGEVALVIAAAGLQSGVLEQSSFSIVVAMTLVTTLITPALLRIVFHREAGEGTARGQLPGGRVWGGDGSLTPDRP
jgi:Kef-type K+ transport system membrane component KefB